MDRGARLRAGLVVIVASAAALTLLLVVACSGVVRATGDGGGGGSSGGGGGSSGGSGSSGSSSGTGSSGSGSGSSGGSSIVGEWQLTDDAGVNQEAFFNADDTCGFIESYGGPSGTDSTCVSNYVYSVSGDVLTVDEIYDSGFSNSATADFSISGDTLILTPADGGFSVLYTRVNAYSSNHCP
jgi:hypothetical protein